MFICMQIKDYKQLTAYNKIRFRLGRYSPSILQVTEENFQYCLVEVVSRDGQINFEQIYNISPRLGKFVVMPRGVEPPDTSKVHRHRAARLLEQVGLAAAVAACDTSQIPLARRSIGLIDEEGIYSSFAEKMIKHLPTVKVYTQNPGRYEDVREQMMDIYGAPLLVDDRPDFLRGCDLVYAPASIINTPPTTASGGPPIFLANPEQAAQYQSGVYAIGSLKVPEEISDLVPRNIDPVDFLDAAYLYCGYKELENIQINEILCRGHAFPFKVLVQAVEKKYTQSARAR